MSMLFLLCLIIWTLQSMGQDKKHCYINELCGEAKKYTEKGNFELALHYYYTAIKFCTLHRLDNTDAWCDVWTQLGTIYYTQWLQNRSVQALSEASDHFRKAIHYSYPPALEAFGLLSMECGNFQEAIKYLNKAAQDQCNVALNYRRIGICYKQIEDYRSTTKFFWKAYSLGDLESFALLKTL